VKIKVTLKDPDTMQDAVRDAVTRDVKALGLSARESALLIEDRTENESTEITHRWMEYGEYLSVEFDTEAGTATVVERK
jgi:hypothetical protein